jgi:hypothetical protein
VLIGLNVSALQSAGPASTAAVNISVTTPAPARITLPNLTGRYDVGVPKNISLAVASTSLSKEGAKILFGFPALHVLVVQLTPSEEVIVSKNPDASWVQKEVGAIPLQISIGSVGNPLGGIASGRPPVAIIDSGDHGQAVLAAYQQECGANCPDPNPLIISDVDPTGNITDDSIDDAIEEAVNAGAKIINISGGACGDTSEDCATGSVPLSYADTETLQWVAANDATLVVAAGNSPTYTNPLSLPNPYSSSVVVVGGSIQNADGSSQPDPAYSSNNVTYFAPDTVASGLYDWGGTSFAAPRVTAEIALGENNTGSQDVNQIMNSVTNSDSSGILKAIQLDGNTSASDQSDTENTSNTSTVNPDTSPSDDGGYTADVDADGTAALSDDGFADALSDDGDTVTENDDGSYTVSDGGYDDASGDDDGTMTGVDSDGCDSDPDCGSLGFGSAGEGGIAIPNAPRLEPSDDIGGVRVSTTTVFSHSI